MASGGVGIGTNNPQATLDVRGGIFAGNSDIYFSKTDRNHSGIGNTVGWAAIENAANYHGVIGGCSSVGRVQNCDSCCRGCEPHQPPQKSRASLALGRSLQQRPPDGRILRISSASGQVMCLMGAPAAQRQARHHHVAGRCGGLGVHGAAAPDEHRTLNCARPRLGAGPPGRSRRFSPPAPSPSPRTRRRAHAAGPRRSARPGRPRRRAGLCPVAHRCASAPASVRRRSSIS